MCAMRPLSRTGGKPESGQAGLGDNAGADAETAREAMLRINGSRLPGLSGILPPPGATRARRCTRWS
ncbi:hypothetical protein [Desulfobulbus oralis]|uniref:hypothetical protein n=1 Tax=Desulfobulbus oralis TaxID=1986146 RepID=UPI0015E3F68B|nr:hypothetical protein [Desulfobulbus oralis]